MVIRTSRSRSISAASRSESVSFTRQDSGWVACAFLVSSKACHSKLLRTPSPRQARAWSVDRREGEPHCIVFGDIAYRLRWNREPDKAGEQATRDDQQVTLQANRFLAHHDRLRRDASRASRAEIIRRPNSGLRNLDPRRYPRISHEDRLVEVGHREDECQFTPLVIVDEMGFSTYERSCD